MSEGGRGGGRVQGPDGPGEEKEEGEGGENGWKGAVGPNRSCTDPPPDGRKCLGATETMTTEGGTRARAPGRVGDGRCPGGMSTRSCHVTPCSTIPASAVTRNFT